MLHYAECGVALFCIVLYFFVWHHYVVYRTVPYTHCAIMNYLCHIDLYCAVVYSIVLYSTVQYCSVLCQMADSVYSCDVFIVLHYAVPY